MFTATEEPGMAKKKNGEGADGCHFRRTETVLFTCFFFQCIYVYLFWQTWNTDSTRKTEMTKSEFESLTSGEVSNTAIEIRRFLCATSTWRVPPGRQRVNCVVVSGVAWRRARCGVHPSCAAPHHPLTQEQQETTWLTTVVS